MTPDPSRSDARAPSRREQRHSCGGCPTTWTGLARAHCSACHRTFNTPRLFDDHRTQVGPRGSCTDPATIAGMVLRDGIWRGEPMSPAALARRRGATPVSDPPTGADGPGRTVHAGPARPAAQDGPQNACTAPAVADTRDGVAAGYGPASGPCWRRGPDQRIPAHALTSQDGDA